MRNGNVVAPDPVSREFFAPRAGALLAPVRPVFRAVATTVVPEARRLDSAGWLELEQIVERALAERPARMRRQLRFLIRIIEWLPVARYGRSFPSLDAARQALVLAALQDAPVLLLRRGFWGLRTLVFLGYYGRGAAPREIGYPADRRGGEARR
jgi:hypothetical protein